MIYQSEMFNVDILRAYIQKSNMTEGQFCKRLWGKKSHYTLAYLNKRKSVSVALVIRICNILDIHFDDLFFSLNPDGKSPHIYGNGNIQNSTVITNDVTALRTENTSLREHNETLKKQNAFLSKQLDSAIEIIHNSGGYKQK